MPCSGTVHNRHSQPDSSIARAARGVPGGTIALTISQETLWMRAALRSQHNVGLCFCLEGTRRPIRRGNTGSSRSRGQELPCEPLILGWDAEWASQGQEKNCNPQEGRTAPLVPRRPWVPCQTVGSSWASRNIRRIITIYNNWHMTECRTETQMAKWLEVSSRQKEGVWVKKGGVRRKHTHVLRMGFWHLCYGHTPCYTKPLARPCLEYQHLLFQD